jgi:hypothetical protein
VDIRVGIVLHESSGTERGGGVGQSIGVLRLRRRILLLSLRWLSLLLKLRVRRRGVVTITSLPNSE